MTPLFRACVRAFPRAFRDTFGEELLAQAEHEHAIARRRGALAGVWNGAGTAANLLSQAIAERWRPTWHAGATGLPTKGTDMHRLLEQWLFDFKFGARSLRRTPGFAFIATGTLALAFGITAGLFSVVNTVLIHPLPYANPDRLVAIGGSAPGSDLPPEIGASQEIYVHALERSGLIEDAALVNSFTSTMRAGEHVERIRMSSPTYTLFSTLGAKTVLGRLPTLADENRTALLSYTLWDTWFGKDPSVLGQTFPMAGENRTVIGVLSPDFGVPTDLTLVWLPSVLDTSRIVPGRFGARMLARVKPGTTTDALAKELTLLGKELPARFGGSPGYARVMREQYRATVTPLSETLIGGSARPLWVLFAGAGVVLLIACANVANLFLVRSENKHREMAVRQAIGAGRGQLVRVQLAEVMIVAGGAAVLAVILARFALPIFIQLAPTGVPRLGAAHVDLETSLFTAALAIVAGLLCGLLPAYRASKPDMLRLRDGARGSTSARHWLRNTLVGAQTALALVLLVASGLLLRSHAKLSQVNPGYNTADIFTFQIAPEQSQLKDGPSFARFEMDFMDRMRALPGVQSVGLIENVPLDEGTSDARFLTDAHAEGGGALMSFTFAGADYYQTMGINVLAGRPFTREDSTTSLGNVVISKSAAERLWPGENAVGRRLQRVGLDTWETVVGVVDDVMQEDFRTPAQALVYFPMQGQKPTQWALGSPAYVVKSTRAETIAADIRALVREIAPEAPMYRAFTMASLASRSMSDLSFTMFTLGLVAAMALVLGAVGLYGVLSYVVAERTREIGVRMALGAEPRGVRRMVVLQGARVVGAGVLVGLAAAWATTAQLGALLFGVEPFDAVTFVGTALTMVLIGFVASYVPARRASNVDPITSLRD